MEEQSKIRFTDLKNSRIPLGFRNINTNTLPDEHIVKKITRYNTRFKQATYQTLLCPKPISKIVK